MKTLEKDLTRRYDTAKALAENIARHFANRGIRAAGGHSRVVVKSCGASKAVDPAGYGGDLRAMIRISELYRTGRGVPIDNAESQRFEEMAGAPQPVNIDASIIKDISGENRITEEAVLGRIGTRAGDRFSKIRLDRDLRNVGRSALLENASIIQEQVEGGLHLIVHIETTEK